MVCARYIRGLRGIVISMHVAIQMNVQIGKECLSQENVYIVDHILELRIITENVNTINANRIKFVLMKANAKHAQMENMRIKIN